MVAEVPGSTGLLSTKVLELDPARACDQPPMRVPRAAAYSWLERFPYKKSSQETQ
jgi:hypothetical protein